MRIHAVLRGLIHRRDCSVGGPSDDPPRLGGLGSVRDLSRRRDSVRGFRRDAPIIVHRAPGFPTSRAGSSPPFRVRPLVAIARSLVFLLPPEGLPAPLLSLLTDYRLLVTRLLRVAVHSGTTSMGRLDHEGRRIADEMRRNGWHGRTACRVALSLAKGHRRWQRRRIDSSIPYVRRPFLRADDRTFHFDRDTGKFRVSLRNGEWVGLTVPVPRHHRAILSQQGTTIKQAIVTPTQLILIHEREPPAAYPPTSLLAFDTNESSLDGVAVTPEGNRYLRVPFPEARTIQSRHGDRRRRLAKKKAHDRRVARRLLGREGRRERHRVTQRLHGLSNGWVQVAQSPGAAIALEDLRNHSGPAKQPRGRDRRGPSLRRRL
jgi:hypothetical protein